jgi:hypothetical protein
MLDRTKLLYALQQVSDSLFVSYANEYTIAQKVWHAIAQDPTFIHKIKSAQVPWPLPTWHGRLDQALPVTQHVPAYRALSVDGSQIYPDRHQGVGCFLINIGSVVIEYGHTSSVQLHSIPHVFMGDSLGYEGPLSTEYVNAKRQEFEFDYGLTLCTTNAAASGTPSILFFDGSLIFWHLSSKEQTLKDIFFHNYCNTLAHIQKTDVLFACYISMPKNRELVSLIKTALSDFDANSSDAHTHIEHVTDVAVANFFLEPFQRTLVFKSTLPLCAEYPPDLWPHFFYLHVGDEIVRLEIPAYIAYDDALVDCVASLAADQAIKGRGYPVVLAEAHEQAVVKGPDRDFFYQLITKFGIDHKKRISLSQKNIKKRGIGI